MLYNETVVNQELLSYIKSVVAQGYTVEQLRNFLIQQGHSQIDVDDTIRQFLLASQSLGASSEKINSPTKKIVLSVVILAVLLVIATGAYLLSRGSTGSEPNNKIPAVSGSQTGGVAPLANEPQAEKAAIITTTSQDKTSNTVYSELTAQFFPGTFGVPTSVQITAQTASSYDRFIGGVYYLSPKNFNLLRPVPISITYTDNAVAMYGKDISKSELTLAYFDENSFEYIPIPSTFDRASKTVSGEISIFYGRGITITAKKPDSSANTSLCEGEGDQEAINRCITNAAVSKNDLLMCNSAKDYNLKYSMDNDAKGGCYAQVIAQTKDPAICASGNIDQSLCYYKLAFVINDPKFCSQAGSLRADCESFLVK